MYAQLGMYSICSAASTKGTKHMTKKQLADMIKAAYSCMDCTYERSFLYKLYAVLGAEKEEKITIEGYINKLQDGHYKMKDMRLVMRWMAHYRYDVQALVQVEWFKNFH